MRLVEEGPSAVRSTWPGAVPEHLIRFSTKRTCNASFATFQVRL